MVVNVQELKNKYPLIKDMEQAKAVIWMNEGLMDTKSAMEGLTLSVDDIDDAERRWTRFAPFIEKEFPETEEWGGLIESPLKEIGKMKDCLNTQWRAGLEGRLMLKMDSNLAVAGSVKARGGIYEILKHSEDLALEQGMITRGDNYEKFALPRFREFFHRHSIHVGSTGNLGLSIGIMSAKLGFSVTVHMSADARQWKKDMLRGLGVHVILGIKSLYFSRQLTFIIGCVKISNGADSNCLILKSLPEALHIISNGSNGAHAGYYYSCFHTISLLFFSARKIFQVILHGHSAVYTHYLSSYVTSLLRSKKSNQICHILCLAESSHRNLIGNIFLDGIRKNIRHLCYNKARSYCIAGNSSSCHLSGNCLGHTDNTGF